MPAENKYPDATILTLERVLHALSDPIRLDLVRLLARNGTTPCGSMDYPVSKSTLSHHFRTLRLSGLTHTDVVGTQHYLTLRVDAVEGEFPGLLSVVGARPVAVQ